MTKTEQEIVLDFYAQTHAKYGPSAQGVGWASEERQLARFRALTARVGGLYNEIESLLDVGCGYGDLVAYLQVNRSHWFPKLSYIGVDLHADAVEIAKKRYEHLDNCTFVWADVRDKEWYKQDMVVASGLLANYPSLAAREMVKKLWQLTGKVLAFNFVDGGQTNNAISCAWAYLSDLKPVHWELRHNYLEDDTTLIAWKVNPYEHD